MCRAFTCRNDRCERQPRFDGFCAIHYGNFERDLMLNLLKPIEFTGTTNRRLQKTVCDTCPKDDMGIKQSHTGLFYMFKVYFGKSSCVVNICKKCYNKTAKYKDFRWSEEN